MTQRTLARVASAAEQRHAANSIYLQRIRQARAEGHTLDAIAHAAGVTRQTIHYLTRKDGTP